MLSIFGRKSKSNCKHKWFWSAGGLCCYQDESCLNWPHGKKPTCISLPQSASIHARFRSAVQLTQYFSSFSVHSFIHFCQSSNAIRITRTVHLYSINLSQSSCSKSSFYSHRSGLPVRLWRHLRLHKKLYNMHTDKTKYNDCRKDLVIVLHLSCDVWYVCVSVFMHHPQHIL